MFVDVALARRIEHAEARLTRAIAGAARPPAALRPLGGGVSSLGAAGAPTNKVIGIGFDDLDELALAEVEAAWRAAAEPVRAEIATLADPAALALLAARGYAALAFENVLGVDLAIRDDEPLPEGVTVEHVTADTEDAWAYAAVEGFATPDGSGQTIDEHDRVAVESVMADFVRTPGMHRYLARYRGEPAGAASVHFDDGIAQLCGATTLPDVRRRGVQRALLTARLAEARLGGCDLAVITTAPGSQSQANAQRRGFALLYARTVLIKPWPREAR